MFTTDLVIYSDITTVPMFTLGLVMAILLWHNCSYVYYRFGDGYTILIRVSGATPNLEPVERYINTMFPGSTLKEKHHNMLQYQLGPTIKLSYIFGQIESVRHEFSIEDYSVSQTTLDQVSVLYSSALPLNSPTYSGRLSPCDTSSL
jgi:hypothetical protein